MDAIDEQAIDAYLRSHLDFAARWFKCNQSLLCSNNCSTSSCTSTSTSYCSSVSTKSADNFAASNKITTTATTTTSELTPQATVVSSIVTSATSTSSSSCQSQPLYRNLPRDLRETYLKMTDKGRNSVTCQLFRDMIADQLSDETKTRTPVKRRSREDLRAPLIHLNETDLFMELIKDISNELDMDRLCHKILINVCLLTNCDRGSIFLVRGNRKQRYLVPALFDVTPESSLDQVQAACQDRSTTIPPIHFGVGIAGHVALTKETINIKNAYQDSRFSKTIDSLTGYRTESIMCLPMLNFTGEVIGVAECINKLTPDREFTRQDEEVFRKYLIFCGIGIQNAQLFQMSIDEFKRNQLLLSLAQSIFQETSSLDSLISKMMIQARDLLECDLCQVYLIDTDSQEYDADYGNCFLTDTSLEPGESNRQTDCISSQNIETDSMFLLLFELRSGEQRIEKFSGQELQRKRKQDIYEPFARQVAISGKTCSWSSPDASVLLSDHKDDHEDGQSNHDDKSDTNASKLSPNSDKSTATDCKSNLEPGIGCSAMAVNILCIPILSASGRIIGVTQLSNSQPDKYFTELDTSTVETFAVFCGLGIQSTQMYEKAIKLMAKQKVAIEVLSYHVSSSDEEVSKLMNSIVLTCDEYKLHRFDFTDETLSEADTCSAVIRMFLELNLVKKFQIPYQVLCKWILSVKKNYRPVAYHNWRHSINVTQTMFAILTTGGMSELTSDLEHLALLVACLSHDLDHRGTNNSYQIKTASPLAILYSTSTMEHHHFDQSVMILNSEGNNILQKLSPDEYRKVIRMIRSAILSTDLAQYFLKREKFKQLATNSDGWKSNDSRDILRGILMTASDLSAIVKPWQRQKMISELIAKEFFEQGDLEREQLKQQPAAMMDREKRNEFPKMQVEFIDDICLPVYAMLSSQWPLLKPLQDGCLQNRFHWQELAVQASE